MNSSYFSNITPNAFGDYFTKRIWRREGVKQMDLVIRIKKVSGGRSWRGEMRNVLIWTCRDQMQMECQIRLVPNGFGDGDKNRWSGRGWVILYRLGKNIL